MILKFILYLVNQFLITTCQYFPFFNLSILCLVDFFRLEIIAGMGLNIGLKSIEKPLWDLQQWLFYKAVGQMVFIKAYKLEKDFLDVE